jgi:hypothetical protein
MAEASFFKVLKEGFPFPRSSFETSFSPFSGGGRNSAPEGRERLFQKSNTAKQTDTAEARYVLTLFSFRPHRGVTCLRLGAQTGADGMGNARECTCILPPAEPCNLKNKRLSYLTHSAFASISTAPQAVFLISLWHTPIAFGKGAGN